MRTSSYSRLGRVALFLSLAGLLAFFTTAARAQDFPDQAQDDNQLQSNDQADPPSRVGRLSYLEGNVSFQPSGDGEWGTATRNRPMTIGDKLWVDQNAKAEVQAGQASIHIASMTSLSFLNLDDNTIQMRLAEGSINFRVRELREGEIYEVDAPNMAFTVTQAGAFRVDVSEDGQSARVTVIRGEGQAVAGGQSYAVGAGQRAEFNGLDRVQYSVTQAPGADGFDQWASQRDLREENSVSAKYVSRDTVGYSDLDDYGTWDEVPEYGHVWYPNSVEVGWAPYSYGSWNYVGPWGWTWVDYSPWGFAPFHYGRWSYISGRWGWCPGPYYARPVYGPAFVGFIGGRNWSVGFGIGGGVGWFPLGWGEPYRPWYNCGPRYRNNINIHNTYIRNTTIINNGGRNFNYAYARNAHAVTATSRNGFVNGERINRGAYRVSEANLRGGQISNRTDFTPNRQSYFGAGRTGGRVATPSAAIQNRSVIARSTPGSAASHMPVRTIGSVNGNNGRGGFNQQGSDRGGFNRNANSGFNRPSNGAAQQGNRTGGFNNGNNSRPGGFNNDRPQSGMREVPRGSNGQFTTPRSANSPNGATRTWEAQGNSSDRGRAPAGFGQNNNRPNGGFSNDSTRGARMGRNDRPPWAGNGNSANSNNSRGGFGSSQPSRNDRPNYSNGGNNRSYEPAQRNGGYANRPEYSNRGNFSPRSYEPPQRNNSGYSNRSYGGDRGSASPRSYNPPQRSYSAPSYSQPRGGGSYSAPRSSGGGGRSYSAPSRSSGGGGGGGNRSFGGGGGSRSSGGGGGGRSHH